MTVVPGIPKCPRAAYSNATFGAQQITSHVILVNVSGEIDLFSAPEFGNCVRRTAGDVGRLIIDMTRVEFFGTAGLDVLRAVNDERANAGRSWAMICGRPVQRLLHAAGLDSAFPCYSSVEGALGSWKIRIA
ncbi:STAS domain-containing protein [Rhodococcus sp. NPDC058521]|uniref:STAS domain-containing protein n=1 Tax=Rhodococcus sp. NPDC058521 TaxID=3346536 RepID=UPI00364C533F